jgi:hypothetical protein
MTAPWKRGRWWGLLALGAALTAAWACDQVLGTNLVGSLGQLLKKGN